MRWTLLMLVVTMAPLAACSGANGDPAPTAVDGGLDAAVALPCLPTAADAAAVADAGPGDAAATAADGG